MLSSYVYGTDIRSLLEELFESQVTEDTAAKFGSHAAERASRYKKDSMPTECEVELNIMVLTLTDIFHDLNAEW